MPYMQNMQPFSYTLRQGDTLQQLARCHQTTVACLLAHNPHIEPHSLRAGTAVMIYPGEAACAQRGEYLPECMPASAPACLPECPSARPYECPPQRLPECHRARTPCPPQRPDAQMALCNDMRCAWEQHVYWTRMLLISIAERLKDQSATTERLLQNPKDIAEIFGRYFCPDSVCAVERLLTEHLEIAANLITALRDGQSERADELRRQWYANADQLAEALSCLSPFYRYEEMRNMLRRHLDLTTQEIEARLAGHFEADIRAFDQVEREALLMADEFTDGIVRQFPQKFRC